MTSQILAIFYLNDLDHFIKENLKIKYYVRYQDDFCLFHPSKSYLRFCLNSIKIFLNHEKLLLNKKTRIYKSSNEYFFLGRTISNKKSNYRTVYRRLILKRIEYEENKATLYSYVMSRSSLLLHKGEALNKNQWSY